MALTCSLNSSARGWNVQDKLVKLADIQAKRVLALFAQERQSGPILVKLNTVIKDYANLLLKIQELRFDVGLDEYRRGIPQNKEADRKTQEQVREAIENVEKIFRKHKIPQQIGN